MSINYVISHRASFEMFDFGKNDIVYSLNPNLDQLTDLFSIFSIEEETLLPIRYRNMFGELGLKSDFCHFLPKYVFRNHVSRVKSAVESILSRPGSKDYITNYLKIKTFLEKLNPPLVDKKKIADLSKKQTHDGPKESILKFASGSSPVPTAYSNSSTATGRLTVKSGPNILTAPAPVRSCFKSSFVGGRILQVDIVAAEPKFALHVKNSDNKKIPADVYEDISTKVFSGMLSRAQIKIATLCALYGQSSSKLALQLPAGKSASQVVLDIKEYFGVNSLKQRLSEDFNSGYVSNFIGRPLKPADEGLLISYFLQSSVAECSILMFKDFCDKNPGIKPCYIIHDALIIDVPREFCSDLTDGSSIDLFFNDWKFESKVTFLDNI